MKPRASTKSTNPKTTGNFPKERPAGGAGARASRAHRNDTTEAREQVARIPKTHPTRNAQSARKDSPAKNRRGNE
jgi:hypothetical protein